MRPGGLLLPLLFLSRAALADVDDWDRRDYYDEDARYERHAREYDRDPPPRCYYRWEDDEVDGQPAHRLVSECVRREPYDSN